MEKGDIITREGVLYPQDSLAIKGLSDVQNYLISEVQKVYRLQGVEINDKHLSLIHICVANNIKSARKMVERAKPEVWDSLETVIKGHPVLLNLSLIHI